MTRKDYILIADVLKQSLIDIQSINLSSTHEGLIKEAFKAIVIKFSIALNNDNPRFDLVKFEKACGIDS